ncbi:hypothetical protein DPMN_087651 [Dreissena polymorpha]|uniref:Secreted protein n=1 Tax=Dreissena polymorpha TaxID=45954 RepID=A0A9D4QVP7_DREPO|nr:hypothetical protein DPMN_153451 [Dreissena polymorpha]KAH3845371.1 hypothetical protein DPMN_087651 [Dreissena polymorpha]
MCSRSWHLMTISLSVVISSPMLHRRSTAVQLPSRSLKDMGLNCVPGLSRTHTDNQGINTVILEPYTAVSGPLTAATRTIPDGVYIPNRHGSTWQF